MDDEIRELLRGVDVEDVSDDTIATVLCRRCFWDFSTEFWSEIPGAGILIPNWHIRLLCDELQVIAERVFAGVPRDYDFVANLPPGTSKSSIVSILFPAWIWTRMPSARIMTYSHTEALALDLANKSRTVIKSDKYRHYFPDVEFRADQDTKGYFTNTKGGDRFTCTVGGKTPTGFHAHFIIGDDPLDPKQVVSEAERKTAKEFMEATIPTRKVDKSITVSILVMQRLGVGDPTDVVVEGSKKEGGYNLRQVCLPSELEMNEDGTYTDRGVLPVEAAKNYVDGLLDVRRLGRKVLAEAKANGAYYYSAQFLQRPYTLSGGLFKVQYFNQRTKAAPFECRRIRFWDRASTAGAGCRTAGVLLAKDSDGNFYVEHVVVGQWEPNERNQIMRATALRDRNRYGPKYEPRILIEREGGSSGRDAYRAVARVLAGFPVSEEHVTGSKETRAEPWSAQLAASNVYVVDDGTWDVNDYVMEHVAFPNGSFLDQVDASSGAFNVLAKTRIEQRIHVLGSSNPKDKGIKFAICHKDHLSDVVTEQRTLLAFITNVADDESVIPPHGLKKMIDSTILKFDDVDPKDYQEIWQESRIEERMATREHAKKFWWFVLRHRDPQPELIIFSDTTDGQRAKTLAIAACDAFRRPRNAIYDLSGETSFDDKVTPSNLHLFDLFRYGKNLVVA